jgi:hypothetical protein
MAKQPVVGSIVNINPNVRLEENGRAELPAELAVLDPKELHDGALALRKLRRMIRHAEQARSTKDLRLWGKTIGGAPVVLVNEKIKRAGQAAVIRLVTEAFMLGVKHHEEFKACAK